MSGTRVFVLDQAAGLWGAQSYLLRLAGPMSDRGIELVLGGSPELALAQAWTARGLAHVELPLPLERSVRADGNGSRLSATAMAREGSALVSGARAIARAAKACRADVIHANGHAVHLEAAVAGRLARIPVVLHLHEEMEQAFGRALRLAAVAVANRSVAVSNAVAGGIPTGLCRRVQVISNGVDVKAFRPGPGEPAVRASLGAGPSDVLMLALTRLDPEKRIEDLIDAAARLHPEPGWHLAVVGATSSYDAYARDVMARGADRLGGRVSFPGRREDVTAIVNAADIVVHAGMVEGMPLGLIEAQACATPVIAYAVAGVPEAVVDGVTGMLAAGADVSALAEHMQALIDEPSRRLVMGARGREHAAANHDIEIQADAYAELVNHLAPNRRKSVPETTSPAPLRILLANHWHDDNRGDSAISQGILTLVKSAAPDATVTVATLSEDGARWGSSTRHLQRFWPGLRSEPSPFPTELRGEMGQRRKPRILVDGIKWAVRIIPRLPNLVSPVGPSAWRRLVADHDAVVLVGGSNIFDDTGVPAGLSLMRLFTVLSPAQAGVRAGKPTLLVGHTLGPFSRPLGRRIASVMLRNVSRVVVREAKSVGVAQGIGIENVEEAADMAFALIPDRTAKVESMIAALPAEPRRTLVLSARQHPTLGSAAGDRLIGVFAETARTLIANGTVDGVAVVAHTIGPTPVEDDRPISRRLVAALSDVPVTLVDEDVSPAELSAFYGAVGAVIAVRLHAAILALNAGTATYAVSYLTGKTQGVMTQVGLPDAVGDFATVTPADTVREIEAQLADPGLRASLEKAALVRREELFDSAREWFGGLSGRAA